MSDPTFVTQYALAAQEDILRQAARARQARDEMSPAARQALATWLTTAIRQLLLGSWLLARRSYAMFKRA